ncbi:MAG: SDR family NAD(P)-dependent oxidoreductase [Deltaproteobacteria bacterium]|nr:SDR family NAD(P)-dependent oxidoreductase [Deltaproteobacteria bacterium]MBW2415580.1 SDR family NAD(P)-dependent oxidoreductase [Deltaproteobacteria bacterium]
MADPRGSALIIGVGPSAGLGGALCRRFGAGGYHVIPAGRTEKRLADAADEVRAAGGTATPIVSDATSENEMIALFDQAESLGPLEVVVYNAGNNQWGSFLEMEADFFESVWRVCCLGGFLAGREAARRMLPRNRGTLLFTGATASMRGRPPFAAFASAKAALRIVVQSMAREFGPQGLHVAHVVIDGAIDGDKINLGLPEYAASKGEDGMLGVDAIAETFWSLHAQHRSAWTQELDLRPFKETF